MLYHEATGEDRTNVSVESSSDYVTESLHVWLVEGVGSSSDQSKAWYIVRDQIYGQKLQPLRFRRTRREWGTHYTRRVLTTKRMLAQDEIHTLGIIHLFTTYIDQQDARCKMTDEETETSDPSNSCC